MDSCIVIDGKQYPIPTRFTLGEEAEIERIVGQGYNLEKPGPLGLLALAYIAVKRVNPAVTLQDIEVLDGDRIGVEGDTPEDDAVPPASSADSSVSGGSGNPSGGDGSEGSQEATLASTGALG